MAHDPQRPVECTKCGKEHIRCTGHTSSGKAPCNRWPRKGSTVCDSHGGRNPVVRSRAHVRAELMSWGLGDATVDPGEVLLRLVTQSAARCEMYADLLGKAYDAAERLAAAEQAPDGGDMLAAETARLDLERVMNHGGVAALVGHTYAADKQSGVFATGEAIRGLAKLEAEERDRCANFAAKAVAAGLAERQVRLAEQHGTVLAQVIVSVLGEVGVDVAAAEVRRLIGAHIARVTGMPLVIEGTVAA